MAAGFTGVEDFGFWQSGALLALNTFGGFAALGLSLPLVGLLPGVDAGELHTEQDTDAVESMHEGVAQLQRRRRQKAGQSNWNLRVAAVTFLTARTLNAAVATASAAIQRRHLMVWALFAPKLLFDACILLVCDVAVLAGISVALGALGT